MAQDRSQIAFAPRGAGPFLNCDIAGFAVKETDRDIESFTHVAGQETKRFFALADHTEEIWRYRRLFSKVRLDFFFGLQENVHPGKASHRLTPKSTALPVLNHMAFGSAKVPELGIRPLANEDLDGLIAYFTRPSKADAERMGLDINRVPSATQLRSDLTSMIASPLDRLSSFVLAWCVDGKAMGHSSLKDIVPGDFGRMHLHMWRADLRGKGYGPRFFCLSALDFYDRFNLKRIICEPKADNPMANRMLTKIGFPLILTHVATSSELSVVCELNRYEILRDIAERYLQSHPKGLKLISSRIG